MRKVLVRCLTVLLIGLGPIVVASRPAAAEWFLDGYAGASFTADADVTIRNGTTFDDKVKFDTEAMGGGRLGYWLETLPWLGVAADASYFAPAGDGTTAETRLEVVPLSPLVMFRLPLLESPEFPKGRLQPYLAGGPSFFLTSVKVDVPGLGEESTDWQFEVGVDARAGIAFMITPAVGTFVEGRYTWFSTNPGGRTTEFDIETVHVAGGITIRWP
ncbi:MAG TPA: outer membrane beta-barrel protein [Methylomirabilota bacterium]|nr:outer membrane beta-barrel protein [Methylomirabilota bacterium]